MLLKTYTRDNFYRAKCANCSWVLDKSLYLISKKKEKCPNCYNVGSYSIFPNDQSAHILGGMIHFIDSYNKKITSSRHLFPPQVYLPIIFACSNYETMLHNLVAEIMKKYGNYLGRLGRLIILQETLSRYDREANEKLFKLLTLNSIQQLVETKFPTYFPQLQELYTVRNQVVHGKEIDNIQQAFDNVNKGIDILLMSIDVFRYLHNVYVCKFLDNIDYRKVLRLSKHETFSP